MASLYDDLDLDAKSGGWGNSQGSLKMMQSHLTRNKNQQSSGKRRGNTSSSTLAPVIDLKRNTSSEGDYRFNHQTGKMERVAYSGIGGFLGTDAAYSLGVNDEYNPLYPNDYEDIIKKRKERKKKEAEEARNTSGLCKRPALVGDDYSSDSENDSGDEGKKDSKYARTSTTNRPGGASGAAIAPPSSLLEDVQVVPGSSSVSEKQVEKDVPDAGKYGINSVAAKMMMRMGYKVGQGLGRESQGMSTALQVEKTSKRGGKIIHEKDLPPSSTMNNIPPHLLSTASKVILLRNMVGPGEVDDELEGETAEECRKYGPVKMCMIFELPDAPDDEAVRIFIEFESPESAVRAIMDLNGRYFGGRIVKAGFYDSEKFANLELGENSINL